MSGYNFENLSHFDFELVAQDLLQLELNVPLESFMVGRDTGIDLRYAVSRANPDLVIQVKHYSKSGFPKLMGHMRNEELPKIHRLEPRRYVLVTSVPLSPHRKSELVDLLNPYVRAPSDIFGAEDLNALLRRHPEVERTHFKLWLTSTAVLQTVLHHDIYMRSANLRESLLHKLRVYVPNRSFPAADAALTQHHVCIVAGVPGIEKSMLAEMLMVAHISRGFEPIVVSEDISEAYAVFSPEPQIFYYDDFLGQTSSAEKFSKNEDARLLDFMTQVRKAANKRLVLTTREYILAQAAQCYERFSRMSDQFHKIVINLEDYTRLERAKILYNHLYFSSLPQPALRGITDNQFYREVIGHPNYNPRLIEAMTTLAGDEASSANRFATFFIRTLENPELIWSHAFENQLPPEGQTVLFILATMPNEVEIESISAAYQDVHSARTGSVTTSVGFRQALKTLEGNFVSIQKVDDRHVVSFHNPSIRDFMLVRLDGDAGEFEILLRHARAFDHVLRLWRYGGERLAKAAEGGPVNYPEPLRVMREHPELVVSALDRAFDSELCGVSVYESGRWPQTQRVMSSPHIPMERRLIFLVEAEEETDHPQGAKAVERRLGEVLDAWRRGTGHKEASAELTVVLKESARWHSVLTDQRELFRQWFSESLSDRRDYEAVRRVAAPDVELFEMDELEEITDEFKSWLQGEIGYQIDAANSTSELESELEHLYSVANLFNVDVEDMIDWDRLDEKREELAIEEYEPDYDDEYRGGGRYMFGAEQATIDAMFDSLGERD